VVYDL
jgi:hypothetical protein